MTRSFLKKYQKIQALSKEHKKPLKEVLDIAIKLSQDDEIKRFTKDLRYLSTNISKHYKKRKRFYLNLVRHLNLPDVILEQYVNYMDHLYPVDRFKYIDRLKKMSLSELINHMNELYINPITELEDEIAKEFGECVDKVTHEDLYGFKTDPKSMMLITMAFLRKIRTLTDRAYIYNKYTSLNVEELKNNGIPIDKIKSMILVGLINYIVNQDEVHQHNIINNLFDTKTPFLEV